MLLFSSHDLFFLRNFGKITRSFVEFCSRISTPDWRIPHIHTVILCQIEKKFPERIEFSFLSFFSAELSRIQFCWYSQAHDLPYSDYENVFKIYEEHLKRWSPNTATTSHTTSVGCLNFWIRFFFFFILSQHMHEE